MNVAGPPTMCDHGVDFIFPCQLCDVARWLDRKPPPGSWRDFLETAGADETRAHLHLLEGGVKLDQRDWEEFELARVADPLMEAGHA